MDTGDSRPVVEQIDELKQKIALLDGDSKAYYENSQYTVKQNRELIAKLRKENKECHKKLSDCLAADDHVINKAFEEKPVERAAFKNKTGKHAVTLMDYKISDHEKRLNALRNKAYQREKKLEELKLLYDGQLKEHEEAVKTDEGVSEAAEVMRNLENRLDKAKLKCNEADHIRRTYDQIRNKLEEDSMNYPNVLDRLEQNIFRCRTELKELRVMQEDADLCKTNAMKDLKDHEELVYAERKKREIELQQTKKEADEKKQQQERIERRLQRANSLVEENTMVQADQPMVEDEDQEKIKDFEEAFKRIKEATGVSDTQDVVSRFANQGDTKLRLQEQKQEKDERIARLTEEKAKLIATFEEMKYTGEQKLSSGQQLLEEFQDHLRAAEEERDNAEETLSKNSNILVKVKSGVEHLAEKLHHIKASKSHVPSAQLSPSANEYVLDLLSQSEEKLLKLLEMLEGKDLEELQKQMEQEEFHLNMETKLPRQNTRVNLPKTQRDPNFDDEDDSADEATAGGGEVKTRSQLKREAETMMENKNKRKGQGKGKTKRK